METFGIFNVETITILTAATAILSQFLALIEYFRLKARWDFLYLDDDGRKNIRSGFHAEYLATSLLVILVIYFLYSAEIFSLVLSDATIAVFSLTIVLFAMYFCSFAIFYFFSYADILKGIFDKNKYLKITALKSVMSTTKYYIQIILWFLILKNINLDTTYNISIAILLVICSAILLVMLEYIDSKIRIAHFSKTYNIVQITEPHKVLYCIVAVINSECYYAVKAEVVKKKLILYLDTKIILNTKELVLTKTKFDKMERIFNGEKIPCGIIRIG